MLSPCVFVSIHGLHGRLVLALGGLGASLAFRLHIAVFGILVLVYEKQSVRLYLGKSKTKLLNYHLYELGREGAVMQVIGE